MDKKTKIYGAAELFVLFDLAVEVAIALGDGEYNYDCCKKGYEYERLIKQ